VSLTPRVLLGKRSASCERSRNLTTLPGKLSMRVDSGSPLITELPGKRPCLRSRVGTMVVDLVSSAVSENEGSPVERFMTGRMAPALQGGTAK
jgi:hypothetical protein